MRGLQERAARAQPALHVEEAEGWWLRHAPRGPWWVGTALPHGDATPGELVRRVAATEEFYAARGAAAGFQISPGASAAGLDTVLAERGYRRQGPTSLQAAPTARTLAPETGGSPRVRLDDRATGAWLRIRDAVHGPGRDWSPERDMLDRLDRPCAYACALIGDDVVAVGRAVADTGWAGVFGMVTLPGARGKGAARGVLAALAGWAGAHGIGHMYLQVERDNMPARRLYERAGFREICSYHYRTTW